MGGLVRITSMNLDPSRVWRQAVALAVALCCCGCGDGQPKAIERPVHLTDDIWADVQKSESNSRRTLMLSRNGEVLVAIAPFGNGQTIHVSENGLPAIVLVQSADGLEMFRHIRDEKGKTWIVSYDKDGNVIERRPADGAK